MLIFKCQISVALNLGSRPGLGVRGGRGPCFPGVPPFPIWPGIGAPREAESPIPDLAGNGIRGPRRLAPAAGPEAPLLVLRNADSGPVSGLPPPSNCPKRAPTRMDSEDASDDDDAEMADYGCHGTDDEDPAHPPAGPRCWLGHKAATNYDAKARPQQGSADARHSPARGKSPDSRFNDFSSRCWPGPIAGGKSGESD
jgi:hypothetical protein